LGGSRKPEEPEEPEEPRKWVGKGPRRAEEVAFVVLKE
jgi:hypothetical protein